MNSLRPLWSDPALRAMCAAILFVGSVVASLAPYQSLIAVTVFDLSETTYAVVLFCGAVMSVVASLSIGIWNDQRAQRRPAALFAASAGLVAASLVAVVQAPWAFVVAHVLFFPMMVSLFGQIFGLVRLITSREDPTRRDALMSAVRALFAVPFVVVLPLWALAYANGFPLAQIYAVLVVMNLLLLASVFWLWPRDGTGPWEDTASGLSIRHSFAEVARTSVLIRVFCVGALESGSTLYMILLGLTFAAAPLRDTSDVALFSGFMAGLEVPVMLCMGVILARMRRLHAIVMGTLIYAAFLAIYPWLTNTSAIWLMMLPGAFGGAIMLSLPLAYLQDLMGARAGAGGALLALQLVIAQGTAALIFAVGTALGGYTTAAGIGACVMTVAVLTLWRLDTRPERLTAD